MSSLLSSEKWTSWLQCSYQTSSDHGRHLFPKTRFLIMVTLPWQTYADADPRHEYLALITFLPRKSYWSIFSFLRLVRSIQSQLKNSKGLIGYSMRTQLLGKKAWTLSVWQDENSLQEFVYKTPHADTMGRPVLQPGKSKFVRWKLAGSNTPPSWDDAFQQLRAGS